MSTTTQTLLHTQHTLSQQHGNNKVASEPEFEAKHSDLLQHKSLREGRSDLEFDAAQFLTALCQATAQLENGRASHADVHQKQDSHNESSVLSLVQGLTSPTDSGNLSANTLPLSPPSPSLHHRSAQQRLAKTTPSLRKRSQARKTIIRSGSIRQKEKSSEGMKGEDFDSMPMPMSSPSSQSSSAYGGDSPCSEPKRKQSATTKAAQMRKEKSTSQTPKRYVDETYKLKRARNNEAVRKCRIKKKQEMEFREKQLQECKDKIKSLSAYVKTLKQLFQQPQFCVHCGACFELPSMQKLPCNEDTAEFP
eukprot:gene5269-7049_t